MPIVNGTYVYDKIPENFTDKSVTGIAPKNRDFSDSKSAQLNYIMKQQENAFNLEMWNLANSYNSPSAQMQRFQDAGLNPNLVYSQQNTTSPIQAASNPAFRSQGTYAKQTANALSMIGEIMNTVRAARETYDYMQYGRRASSLENQVNEQRIGLLARQETGQMLQNAWTQWLQGRLELDPNAPAVRLYNFQSNVAEQRYEQLKALVNMIPDQQARTRALKQLDDERLSILKSQTGFITNFDTGHPEFDSFFKMLAFFVMNSGT